MRLDSAPQLIWEACLYLVRNRAEHGVRLRPQQGIPESHDPVASRFKPSISLRIPCRMFGLRVLPAIEFDNNARLVAGEISNVSPDYNLTPELCSESAKLLQSDPEQDFFLCHVLTEALGVSLAVRVAVGH